MKCLALLCSLLIISVASLTTLNEKSTCGYTSCPTHNSDPNVLNVHLVAHSHNDVGRLKTVDQYYYGTENYIQYAGVKYILDSVVQALLENPIRRYIQVETAYFWMWWQEQNDKIRAQVRNLVNNGQLELTGGAWSMNDEATTHYQSIIDQFTWGFRKLNDTLGNCARPKIGWQIDTYGHSRETASLFSQFGFDGLFFARLDSRDRTKRLTTKTAEMLWQGSANLGKSSELFTSVLYSHYDYPSGFCFDVKCSNPSTIAEYNAEFKAREFVNYVQTQGQYYKTNNVIVPMGCNFAFHNAKSSFNNIDKLIKATNDLNINVTVFYSSPACYVKAVNEANEVFPTKTDDFFPYADDSYSYWSGYFTSRPTLKRYERMGNNILQVAKQLSALSGPISSSENRLDKMREALGIMQHHDAITGTARQHVVDDYARMLSEAFKLIDHLAEKKLRKLSQTEELQFQSCLQLNISQCDLTEDKDKVYITVYNPLSRPVSHYVRVPVTSGTYGVYFDGNIVPSQIVPIFQRILSIPGRVSAATHEIVFQAELIPPLGFKSYQMIRSSHSVSNKTENITEKAINLKFYKGRLKSIKVNNEEIQVSQNYLFYIGDGTAERPSGAHIFRPNKKWGNYFLMSAHTDPPHKYDGPLVTEYHQFVNNYVGQVIRVYNKENYVEFNWIVGPIPGGTGSGKEIITRFKTDLNSNGVFYTDSNGREMIQRVRGVRETFNLTHEQPIAENYYPVTSKITIKDESTNIRVSILNDRAQGGSSLTDGEVELMAPPHTGSQYYNYKNSHSMVLLALCDADYKFTMVDIGASGRQSDGGVLRNSEFGKRLYSDTLDFPPAQPVEYAGEVLPMYIIGDEAFPLRKNIMRPFPKRFLSIEKRVFNYRLCRARRVIVNTFGILASRWRIYRKPIIASLKTTTNIIKATVCLHNFIMSNKERNPNYCPKNFIDEEDLDGNIIERQWRSENTENLLQIQRSGSNFFSRDAASVRDSFAAYFMTEGAIPFQWNK